MPLGLIIFAYASMLNPASTHTITSDQKQEWSDVLSEVSSQLSVSIAFDIGTSPSPDKSLWTMGELGLDKLAQDALRTRQEVEGVQVFVRRQPNDQGNLSTFSQRLLGILRNLKGSSLKKLLNEGLNVGDLSEDEARELLVSLPMNMMNMRELNRAARGGGLKIALDIDARYNFMNPKTNRQVRGQLSSGGRFGKWFGEARTETHADLSPEVPAHWVGQTDPSPDDGDLDFGKGRILSLEDLVKEASGAFDARYFFDRRLKDSTYFFSGRYTQERFKKVIDSLMKPVPLTETIVPEFELSLNDLRSRIKSILMDTKLPYSNSGKFAFDNRSILSDELMFDGQFAQIIRHMGLGSTSIDVTLRPVMYLAVFMAGETTEKHVAFRLSLGELGG